MGLRQPTGGDLVSATTNCNTLPAPFPFCGWEERTFNFGDGVELTGGEAYAIVLRLPDYSEEYPHGVAICVNCEGGCSGVLGLVSDDGGTTWEVTTTAAPGWFSTYENGNLRNYCNFEPYICGTWAGNATKWRSLIFTAPYTYTITSLSLLLCRSEEEDSPGNLVVGIRETEALLPGKPKNPNPVNGATDVLLNQTTISWESGGNTQSYNVYYGENEENLSLVSVGQSETSFSIVGINYGSPFDYEESRAWRIDAVYDSDVTTGDVWTFSTIPFYPPATGEVPTHKRLVAAAENTIWYEDI